MTKKMGFWLWLILQPFRLTFWLLGCGKEAVKGNLQDRVGITSILYMIISFPILLIYDYLTNFSLTNYSIFLIMGIVSLPAFIILVMGFLYVEYLEEKK